jgi:hypothetical protein
MVALWVHNPAGRRQGNEVRRAVGPRSRIRLRRWRKSGGASGVRGMCRKILIFAQWEPDGRALLGQRAAGPLRPRGAGCGRRRLGPCRADPPAPQWAGDGWSGAVARAVGDRQPRESGQRGGAQGREEIQGLGSRPMHTGKSTARSTPPEIHAAPSGCGGSRGGTHRQRAGRSRSASRWPILCCRRRPDRHYGRKDERGAGHSEVLAPPRPFLAL